MRVMFAAAGLAAALVTSQPARADYPDRPIRMVIASAAGGLTDGFVRLIGDALQAAWGQPVIMDHRAGAGGIVGTDLVAKAPPNGYTLLLGNNGPLAVNPGLYKTLPYDADKDFQSIVQIATYPNVLVVTPSLPVSNLQELLALARAKPGTLFYASAGVGQSQHLGGELLARSAGINIVHVPYKGTAPALNDLFSGQVSMMFSNLPATIGHIQSGAVKAIALTGLERSAVFPNLPTIAESVPGYEIGAWLILMAPAGTPPDIVAKLHNGILAINKSEKMQQYRASLGAITTDRSPAELDRFIAAERVKWTKIVRDAKIEAE